MEKTFENLNEEARFGAEMDILFDEIELSEHEMIFEDTFHKICKHFYIFGKQVGAEWIARQGVSMIITDDTEWSDVDSFIHKNVSGDSIIQIRKK